MDGVSRPRALAALLALIPAVVATPPPVRISAPVGRPTPALTEAATRWADGKPERPDPVVLDDLSEGHVWPVIADVEPMGLEIVDAVPFAPERILRRPDVQIAYRRDWPSWSAYRIARPVPEPEAWALMILGFALVGAVARRRAAASLFERNPS